MGCVNAKLGRAPAALAALTALQASTPLAAPAQSSRSARSLKGALRLKSQASGPPPGGPPRTR